MLGTDVGTQRNEEEDGEEVSDIEEVDEVDPYQKWFGRRVVSSSDKNAFNKITASNTTDFEKQINNATKEVSKNLPDFLKGTGIEDTLNDS